MLSWTAARPKSGPWCRIRTIRSIWWLKNSGKLWIWSGSGTILSPMRSWTSTSRWRLWRRGGRDSSKIWIDGWWCCCGKMYGVGMIISWGRLMRWVCSWLWSPDGVVHERQGSSSSFFPWVCPFRSWLYPPFWCVWSYHFWTTPDQQPIRLQYWLAVMEATYSFLFFPRNKPFHLDVTL